MNRQESRSLPVYVTIADVHRMLEVCNHQRDRLLIELLWRTGGRISEVLSIRVGDITKNGIRLVNLKQGSFRTQPDGSKKHISIREEKHVIIDRRYLETLKAQTKGLPLSTPLIGRLSDGKPISRKTAWEIVTAAAARAGVFRRHFSDGTVRPAWCHTFRHGHAVNLLENGLPITIAQDQLGHKSLANTQVYTKIVDPRKEELINAVRF